MTDYSDFRVLIDDAATAPQLGFSDYAQALSEIIRHSTPEFAIGIFGSWGTGKTTLMRQIDVQLGKDPAVVTAWFTAWRYEREPHLIVPLIDVLREALDKHGDRGPGDERARRAAGKLRKAGRAFLAGLTLSAKVPGLSAQLDPAKVLHELRDEPDDGKEALSFYHAAFLLLRDAILEFSDGGSRRLVVFVDDLDRCLPANALEVLESMKLFFDVQGCIFVVGLDQAVAERAVAQKYAVADRDGDHAPVSGVDYLKKIFQVPFALPRVGTDQLRQYCRSMMTAAGLGQGQLSDFEDNVSRHLEFLPSQDAVNPREIKRLINAYVLQVKMLGIRMSGNVDPSTVLALQIMSFRPDWRDMYEELAADPLLFQQSLGDALAVEPLPDRVWITARFVQLSAQFAQYLRGPAAALLDNPHLPSYVSAAESSRSSDRSLLDAQVTLNRVREATESLAEDGPGEASSKLHGEVSRLTELLAHRTWDQSRLKASIEELEGSAREVTSDADPSPEHLERQATRLRIAITALEAELREMRRQSNLGASSFAS